MQDEDGAYLYDTTDQERLRVFDELQKPRKGVWINRGKFITLDSGRRVYTSEIIIHSSDDYAVVLGIAADDILPCETLLDGYRYFLTDLNAPGVYAVGSMALARKVLGMNLSGYSEHALRRDIASRNASTGWTAVQPNSIALGVRLSGRCRRNKNVVSISTLGALADMSDVRDIVRNKDLLLSDQRVEVVGDVDMAKAVELEPNLAAGDRRVLRYVTRKAPPGGYAPNPNKPVVALAYTASLTGDPVYIAKAMDAVMRDACADELDDLPTALTLTGSGKGEDWLLSYARIVMWRRRIGKLPAALRDPVALLLPGAGHAGRTDVATAVASHVLHLAPVIRREFSSVDKLDLVLALSMLWRILHVPKYAKWRKLHAEVLARRRLPLDAAAKVIASEFCAYTPRIAGGAKCTVDRLACDDYGYYDMTKAKADAVAFLLKYAPKSAGLRQP